MTKSAASAPSVASPRASTHRRRAKRVKPAQAGTPPHTAHAPSTLYRYIWQVSARAQIALALLSVVIFLLDLVPLELQRRIVNDAIGQRAFIALIWMCGVYAVTVLMQGAAKLVWNIYRNSVGEAASKRLRLDTFTAALRHPAPDETATEGVGISIILSEADPVGLFVATSISEPVLHGGVLVAVFAYLIYLQPLMALVALALFVPQCLFVPMVQKAINQRTEARIQVMRRLSVNIVAETAEDGLDREASAYRRGVGDIYSLNMQILLLAQYADLPAQVFDEFPDQWALSLRHGRHPVRRRLVRHAGPHRNRHRRRLHFGFGEDKRPVERPGHVLPRHD